MKHYKTTSYSVRQGRSQEGHVSHFSKMTSLCEYFFKFMSKARRPCLWSVITPIKISGYAHLKPLPQVPSLAQAIISTKKRANI